VRDALKAYLSLASGFTEVPRQRARAAARALVVQGEATAEQVGGLTEELLSQARTNREAVSALAKHEVDRALSAVGVAAADEVAALTARVAALEAEVRRLGGSPAELPPGRTGPAAGPAAESTSRATSRATSGTTARAQGTKAQSASKATPSTPSRKTAQKAATKTPAPRAGGAPT
jgi:polyhydroxyalkanoate synthesis regulator phasin